jgi:hypothetical protein
MMSALPGSADPSRRWLQAWCLPDSAFWAFSWRSYPGLAFEAAPRALGYGPAPEALLPPPPALGAPALPPWLSHVSAMGWY